MAKVIVGKLAGPTARKVGASKAAVSRKRIRGSDGEVRTLLTVSAESDSLDKDFTYVFGRNVAKARRENKRLTGSADRAPPKR
jgi:hypothetical protein